MGFLSGITGAIGGGIMGPVGNAIGGVFGSQQDSGIWTPWSRPGEDWKFDASGAPPIPQYEGVDFSAVPQYQAPQQTQALGVAPDSRGIETLRGLSMGDTSPWTSKLLEKEAYDTQTAGQGLDRATAAQIGRAQEDVAMMGGLTGGASERIAAQGTQAGINAKQNLYRDSASRRLDIEGRGRDQQLQALYKMPELDLRTAELEQQRRLANLNAGLQASNYENDYNLRRAGLLGTEADRKNQFNRDIYGIQGSIWGTGQQADQAANERKNQSLWEKIF
jgi:hypothetical protein